MFISEFTHQGIQCCIRKQDFGDDKCYLGYVLVPENHPWYGVDYDEEPLVSVAVHGGLTFANFAGPTIRSDSDFPATGWWVGFDTAHGIKFSYAMTVDETKKLADQLVEAQQSEVSQAKGNRILLAIKRYLNVVKGIEDVEVVDLDSFENFIQFYDANRDELVLARYAYAKNKFPKPDEQVISEAEGIMSMYDIMSRLGYYDCGLRIDFIGVNVISEDRAVIRHIIGVQQSDFEEE